MHNVTNYLNWDNDNKARSLVQADKVRVHYDERHKSVI